VPVIADADVLRIADATGLPATEIAAFLAYEKLHYPKHASDWIRTDRGPRVMTLKRRGGRCRFADGDGGCAIYDARPDTCRLYPYDWDLDRHGRLRRLRFLPGIDCRGAGDATIDLAALSAAARAESVAFEAYERKVGAWNRAQQRRARPGTAREFLLFLGLLTPGGMR
jgi:Fe-S-cluster containining protein